jgi:hypothetical protein
MLIIKTDGKKMDILPDNYGVPAETVLDSVYAADV